ncbi:MAG: sirohydrochlorin chelatase [Acidimicrobiales bacterium]
MTAAAWTSGKRAPAAGSHPGGQVTAAAPGARVLEPPALFLIGHGSESPAGREQYFQLLSLIAARLGSARVGGGFLELAGPPVIEALDELLSARPGPPARLVAVPLVLLGASHLKVDGPEMVARARAMAPGTDFSYARAIGVHGALAELAAGRASSALEALSDAGAQPEQAAVLLVGRGSRDTDANSDLYKMARLVQDRLGTQVEAAFVSLASPGVKEALERCERLGTRSVAVVPYFLFDGVLVERAMAQAADWSRARQGRQMAGGRVLGPDAKIADVVVERYFEAIDGGAVMNCDCCRYRPTGGGEPPANPPSGGGSPPSGPRQAPARLTPASPARPEPKVGYDGP